MDPTSIEGKPVRFPPGKVEIRLGEGQRSAYRRLYSQYQSVLTALPVLRERDFDGRRVHVTQAQLDALNDAFAALDHRNGKGGGTAFSAQAADRTSLFKKLQYLS